MIFTPPLFTFSRQKIRLLYRWALGQLGPGAACSKPSSFSRGTIGPKAVGPLDNWAKPSSKGARKEPQAAKNIINAVSIIFGKVVDTLRSLMLEFVPLVGPPPLPLPVSLPSQLLSFQSELPIAHWS